MPRRSSSMAERKQPISVWGEGWGCCLSFDRGGDVVRWRFDGSCGERMKKDGR